MSDVGSIEPGVVKPSDQSSECIIDRIQVAKHPFAIVSPTAKPSSTKPPGISTTDSTTKSTTQVSTSSSSTTTHPVSRASVSSGPNSSSPKTSLFGTSDTSTTTSSEQPAPTKIDDSNSGSNNTKTSTSAIVGGIIGGLAFVVLTILLVYWRKKLKRPHGDLTFFNQWIRKGTRSEEEDNERPVPYYLDYVSVHVDQSMPHLSEPNSASFPITNPSLDVKRTFSPGQQLIDLRTSSSLFESSSPSNHNESNVANTSNTARTRFRAFSESSITRVPSTTSQSTFTARQLNIRSEADELRIQLNAIQQAQAATMLSNDEMKNTLAVMMAHIQRLDRQFDSDWARELSDEAPPEYCDARRLPY
ncbi:hypothetical protein VKT23_018447 [Stygiomarasmius scandens]|uniref:Mid2 domain-containing protein n=1 Tax=Marasmiellus scandens TaxID=2682957 RepID=A0ABR1ITD1_9AGAR